MAKLVEVGNPNTVPSVYFSKAYGLAESAQTGHEWILLTDDDGDWQVPLLLRDFHGLAVDATTPYGYGGIYMADNLSDSDVAARWRSTTEWLHKNGVVSLFLRSAPFLKSRSLKQAHLAGLRLRPTTQTFSVEIVDADQAWTSMKGRARTAVRKAQSVGMTAKVSRGLRGADSRLQEFRSLYEGTMKRLSASDQYFFGDAYYENLSEFPEDRIATVSVRDKDDVAVSQAILLLDPADTVHYHLSGSDRSAARLGANNLLLWEAMRWGSANGFQQVHLGGGVSPRDGLERFKESFGGSPLEFETAEYVVDPEKYDNLSRDRQVTSGTSYFPAYRSPHPAK